MGLCRFFPTQDTWISSRINADDGQRTSDCNFGANPTIQLSKVTSSYPSLDAELTRGLFQFDYARLQNMITAGAIPNSGVSYVLKMFNYEVGDTCPTSFDVLVYSVSGNFDEGIGLDDKTYGDTGYASWNSASSQNSWVNPGGDWYPIEYSASQHFDQGTEDLEIDVTAIVDDWLAGNTACTGFLIKFSDYVENNDLDYWRKVFYSRETQIVEKVPFLEARWNDVRKDNRGNFAYNAPNALYLYNVVRGQLQNYQNEPLTVRWQDNWLYQSASYSGAAQATRQETGVYSVPVSIPSQVPTNYSSSWVDIWQDASGSCLMSGCFVPWNVTGSQSDPYNNFIVDPVMKRTYRTDETARIQVNVRQNWYNDHIAAHTASLDAPRMYMENMFWSVVNNETGETIIPFATGSVPYTKLSYNKDGNYFQVDMNSFVPGFTYRFLFLIQWNKYEKDILDNLYLFKVY